MTEKLLNLSEKIKSPVVTVCGPIAALAKEHNIECFVIGATARDTIMSDYYGLAVRSVTKDVDFGVGVSSWDQFQELTKGLIKNQVFRAGDVPHQFYYKDTNIRVDIVPFGELASENQMIVWPPENAMVMSVCGYEDAYACSINVLLRRSPRLEMRFASPVGLIILKLVAWDDNPMLRKKDAEDILYILSSYLDLNNRKRLIESHGELLDECEFDDIYLGARLLGRDISQVVQDDTKDQLRRILNRESDKSGRLRLVSDMRAGSMLEISAESRVNALRQILLGLDD